ncbi:MAG TPA: N-6 DNA methylase [Methylosinus sp.]
MDEAARRERSVTRRKRAGVVYTPAPIAGFLVARTIALSLDEGRADLLAAHDGRETVDFWRDWLARLRDFAILDPACGEGALLLAAFDEMAPRYEEAARRALGAGVEIDAAAETIAHNLFGVDIDRRAVEAARRALALRADGTSEPEGSRSERVSGPHASGPRSFRLACRAQLETNLRAGDSLVDDRAASAAAFDWRAAFPEIFARGGFDVAIGNPPYVRMEYLKPLKPWLAKHYEVAAERADLYAYFFEKGLALLKPNGRLGYICSASFFRTGSGEPLRALLSEKSAIESVVDFGDLTIFDGVVTYPAIVTLRKGASTDDDLSFLKIEQRLPDDLRDAFARDARPMPRARLGAGYWRLEDDALARLREKIAGGRMTLREIYGAPLWGVKTGLNDAFVIDASTRDRLIAADARSAELLKPYLRGAHIGRWTIAPERLFLIDLPKGAIDDISRFPAIAAHLTPLRARLEARAARQGWFELQQAQRAYRAAFAGPKIVFPDISQGPKFAFDETGTLIDATAFALPHADLALLALLNSRLAWFFLHSVSNPLRGGKWRLRLKAQYVGLAPIPDWTPAIRARLAAAARANGEATSRGAVRETDAREREIDGIVYGLFGLTTEDIALVEASLEGQY